MAKERGRGVRRRPGGGSLSALAMKVAAVSGWDLRPDGR
jgi:hypothetical protein